MKVLWLAVGGKGKRKKAKVKRQKVKKGRMARGTFGFTTAARSPQSGKLSISTYDSALSVPLW
jgi:hypothetical protein